MQASQYRILNGLCISCGGTKESLSLTRCAKCNDAHKERERMKCQNYFSSGKCVRCGKPREDLLKCSCNKCMDKTRKWQTTSRKNKKKGGASDEEVIRTQE